MSVDNAVFSSFIWHYLPRTQVALAPIVSDRIQFGHFVDMIVIMAQLASDPSVLQRSA